MKVKTLLKKLAEMNPDAEVMAIGNPNGIYYSVCDCEEEKTSLVSLGLTERDYYHDALDQLEELIDGLHELGTFEMKSVEEFVDKVRHTTLLDDYRTSELEPDVVDVHYKDIETSLYFSPSRKVKVANYVMFWTEDDEEEPYEYIGTWYEEQRDD